MVEDDEDDQLLISQAIERLGLVNPIQIFPNGEMALTYLKTTQQKPFLILCDINMPLMNGIELRSMINENEYLRQKSIPFIFLTTTANADVVQKAYDESVQGFFQKAVNQEDLYQQLKLIVAYWQSCLHPNNLL